LIAKLYTWQHKRKLVNCAKSWL